MIRVFISTALIFLTALLGEAQSNLVPNGSFERTITFRNLFDGVDEKGRVMVFPAEGGDEIYREGLYPDRPLFSCSPSLADINGDGLPDLIVASPSGWVFIYYNKGKKGSPRFSEAGRFIKTWLGRVPRIQVVDFDGDGKKDILFGTKDGQVYLLAQGNRSGPDAFVSGPGKPRFCWPNLIQAGYDLKPLKIGSDILSVGNYAAPFYANFRTETKPDLLLGEGQYSANAVRIYFNNGNATNPKFGDNQNKDWFYLTFGDGREQLTPAVWDWNGDGKPDLLYGDYDGHINLCLNTRGKESKLDTIESIEFTKYINSGGRESFGRLSAFVPCDWNEDGIPDLLMGTTSGFVQIALGSGNRSDPKIGPAENIMSENTMKDRKAPSGWDYDFVFADYSNGCFIPESISGEEEQDLVMPPGAPGDNKRMLKFQYLLDYPGYTKSPKFLGGNFIEGGRSLRTLLGTMTRGKTYELSFWYRGSSMKIGVELDMAEKFPPRENRPDIPYPFTDVMTATAGWKKYSKKIKIPGTKEKKLSSAPLRLYFAGTGSAYVDDVRVIETGQ
jgi:VCBS repeat protein